MTESARTQIAFVRFQKPGAQDPGSVSKGLSPMKQQSGLRSLSPCVCALIVVSATLLYFGGNAAESALPDEPRSAVAANSPAAQDSATIAFSPVKPEAAQSLMLQWLAGTGADPETARAATSLWADREAVNGSSAEELLDWVVETMAIADPATRRFVDACREGELAETPVFDGIRSDPIYRNSIRLYQARWLTQHRFVDEALEILETMSPDDLIDPAGYFFYRAVCQQLLLQPKQAVGSLQLLLNHTVDVPDRFRAVAAIMMDEIKEQETEGMHGVARLMSDVQRRLDLGRSGEKVQKQEDQVVALLDQLLEEMEKQKQQQQQQSGGGQGEGSQNQPGQQGASESRIKGTTGEGIADRRELSESGSWGMLDQQTEAQARELIRQKFPSNYLDAISRYTRKIAERK